MAKFIEVLVKLDSGTGAKIFVNVKYIKRFREDSGKASFLMDWPIHEYNQVISVNNFEEVKKQLLD